MQRARDHRASKSPDAVTPALSSPAAETSWAGLASYFSTPLPARHRPFRQLLMVSVHLILPGNGLSPLMTSGKFLCGILEVVQRIMGKEGRTKWEEIKEEDKV